MALSLNYSNLAETVQQTNKLGEELGQYCDELSRKIQKNIYSVEGGMSTHLNNADYFIKNKIKNLREKQENAYNISKCVNNLLSTAQRVDDDVARLIENRQKEFFKENPDLKTPLYQSVIQELIGTTPLGSFLLALNLFKHFSPVEELQKNIKNSFKSAFNSAQNYVDNISDKVSSTVKNITDKEDKKSTGNVLAVAGILAGANSVKSWVSDLITNIKDFWQKHWGTTTTTSTTEAVHESYEEKITRLREWSNNKENIQIQFKNLNNGAGQCYNAAHVNMLRRRMELDNIGGQLLMPEDVYQATGSKNIVKSGINYYVDAHAGQTWAGYTILSPNKLAQYTVCNYYTKSKNGSLESFAKSKGYNSINEMLVKMLNEHPEGIAAHALYGENGMHAIVISDYYVENGVYKFNIVDSVNQYVGSFEGDKNYCKAGKWVDWNAFINKIDFISFVE